MAYTPLTFVVGNTLPSSAVNILDSNIDLVRATHISDASSPLAGMLYINSGTNPWKLMMYDTSTFTGIYQINFSVNTFTALGGAVTSNITESKIISVEGDRIAPRQIDSTKIGSLSISNFADGAFTAAKINNHAVTSFTATTFTMSNSNWGEGSASGSLSGNSGVTINLDPCSTFPDLRGEFTYDSWLTSPLGSGGIVNASRDNPKTAIFALSGDGGKAYGIAWRYLDV